MSGVLKTDEKHFESHPYLAMMLVPDITMYMNIWLCTATVASLQKDYVGRELMDYEFRDLAANLIKIFNKNPRWRATQLNLTEASHISVAIAILKVKNDKFIGDICDIIRANIQHKGAALEGDVPLREIEEHDLPNLAKSTFYLRNF